MECKFCQQMLDEGNTVCPNCGKDNAEPILTEETTVQEPVAEETIQPAQIKEGFRMTPGKLALTIAAAVILVAALVALVLWGMGASLSFGGNAEPSEEAQVSSLPVETAPPATIPADGNPDDVTCKGSYSVSNEEIEAVKDTVVATAGDAQLTNAELQVYYWMQVQQFLSEYGGYASYFGLDYTQPLDTQVCMLAESTMTWQQHFLESAILTWQNYLSLSNESLEKGFQIDPQIVAELDKLEATLAADAATNGFGSAEEWLQYNVGAGVTIEDYKSYLNMYYQGYAYFEELYSQFEPTMEELEAYYAEHEEGYVEGGLTKDLGDFVDVRHILIRPEGGTTDASGMTTYSDEEWEACRVQAQEILDNWLAEGGTEERFAQLANEKSADSDGTDGGLYTQVTKDYMVEEFDAWIFDESRVYGDSGLVKTVFGYHVMFFVGRQPQWAYYAESDFIGEKVSETVLAAAEKYPLTVDYSAIALSTLEIG